MLSSSGLLSFRGDKYFLSCVELQRPISQRYISVSAWTAVMNYQTHILQLRRCEWEETFCLCHVSSWNIYQPASLSSLSPLRCDKRLLAPSLNLLCPISGSIYARNRHHINHLFLLKSCCLHFFFFSPAGSSLFREVPLGIIQAFDQVSVTPSIFYSWACALKVCIWVVLCLTSHFEGKQYMRAPLHFVCLCGTAWGCVQSVCLEKEERKWNSTLDELWSMYCYLLCVLQSAWVNRICVKNCSVF